jgi:hypothetical protein
MVAFIDDNGSPLLNPQAASPLSPGMVSMFVALSIAIL